MAGMGPLFGVPVGNIGPSTGANFNPYLEMLRLNQQRQQSAQQAAMQQQAAEQQRQQFEKRMAEESRQFDVGTKQKGEQFGISTELERGGLALREKIGLGELEIAKSSLAQRGEQFEKQHGLAVQSAGLEKAKTEADIEATKERTNQSGAQVKLAQDKFTRDVQVEEEAKARQQQLAAAVADVESNLLPYLENEKAVRAKSGDTSFDVGRAARINIAKKYADNPEAQLAALSKVSEYEENKFKQSMQELDAAYAQGRLTDQQLGNEKARIQLETLRRSEQQLAEAFGADPDLADAITAFGEGGWDALSPEQKNKIIRNPMVQDQIAFIAKIAPEKMTPEDMELAKRIQMANVRSAEADAASAEADARMRTKAAGTDPDTGEPLAAPTATGQPQDMAEMQALKNSGKLGEVGQMKLRAAELMSTLGKDPAKRKKLERLQELLAGLDNNDDLPGSLSPDMEDAIVSLFPPGFVFKKLFDVVQRAGMEAGQGEAGELRGIAGEFGIEP